MSAKIDLVLDDAKDLSIPELSQVVSTLMHTLLTRIDNERTEHLDSLEKATAALEDDKSNWETLANKLSGTQLPTYATLIVGGTTFGISIENLTKTPNTYFSALFSGRWELNLKEFSLTEVLSCLGEFLTTYGAIEQ